MDDNIHEFLVSAAAIFAFSMAMLVFFIISQGIDHMNEAIDTTQGSGKTLYESHGEREETYVTGAQIIYSIKMGLECDIEIDYTPIVKDVDTNTFDYATIDAEGRYTVTHSIDAFGQMIKVIYHKK